MVCIPGFLPEGGGEVERERPLRSVLWRPRTLQPAVQVWLCGTSPLGHTCQQRCVLPSEFGMTLLLRCLCPSPSHTHNTAPAPVASTEPPSPAEAIALPPVVSDDTDSDDGPAAPLTSSATAPTFTASAPAVQQRPQQQHGTLAAAMSVPESPSVGYMGRRLSSASTPQTPHGAAIKNVLSRLLSAQAGHPAWHWCWVPSQGGDCDEGHPRGGGARPRSRAPTLCARRKKSRGEAVWGTAAAAAAAALGARAAVVPLWVCGDTDRFPGVRLWRGSAFHGTDKMIAVAPPRARPASTTHEPATTCRLLCTRTLPYPLTACIPLPQLPYPRRSRTPERLIKHTLGLAHAHPPPSPIQKQVSFRDMYLSGTPTASEAGSAGAFEDGQGGSFDCSAPAPGVQKNKLILIMVGGV